MILVLDTSLVGVAMALVDVRDGVATRLWHGAHPEPAGSILAISGLLEAGLAEVGRTLADVKGIAVSKGPGSFTGIKIGLAFVYGLLRAGPETVTVHGFSALAAAARALAAEQSGAYGLLLPATRTHGFFAVHGASPEGTALLDAGDEGPATARFAALPEGMPLAVSGRWPAAREAAMKAGRSVTEIAPSDVSRLAIYGISGEMASLWPEAFGREPPTPEYLRLSTAEERLQPRV